MGHVIRIFMYIYKRMLVTTCVVNNHHLIECLRQTSHPSHALSVKCTAVFVLNACALFFRTITTTVACGLYSFLGFWFMLFAVAAVCPPLLDTCCSTQLVHEGRLNKSSQSMRMLGNLLGSGLV